MFPKYKCYVITNHTTHVLHVQKHRILFDPRLWLKFESTQTFVLIKNRSCAYTSLKKDEEIPDNYQVMMQLKNIKPFLDSSSIHTNTRPLSSDSISKPGLLIFINTRRINCNWSVVGRCASGAAYVIKFLIYFQYNTINANRFINYIVVVLVL